MGLANPKTGDVNYQTSYARPNNGVFWIGQDGQVYVMGDRGTNAAGNADANTVSYWTGSGYDQINDPLAGSGSNNGNNGLVATGGSGPTVKDTTAARGATQVSLDSLPTVLNNALTGADSEYNTVIDAYNAEDAQNLEKYQGDVENNEITRDNNTQASLLGAARGARGLYATLASLGALGGTGRTLANRAVSTEANADLGEGEKSFKTNASTLFDTRAALSKQEEQRRKDAEKIKSDAKQNAEYDYYKGNQDLAKEMAGLWTDAGNNTEAANWLGRSSSYTPEMAKRTKVNVGQYAKTPLAYSKPELAKYLGGQNSMAVNVAGGTPVNGAIYTSTKKRDEL